LAPRTRNSILKQPDANRLGAWEENEVNVETNRLTLRQTLIATCAAMALCAAGQVFAADAGIPKLGGVWQFGQCVDGSRMRCLILQENDPLLTDRARAFRDAMDEAAQPKYDCAPMSIPHMWTDPYSHQIEQFDDRVVFTYGKDDVVRTAWLPNSKHPKPAKNEFLYFGDSRARYEGGALIVETTRFAFDPQGLNADFRLPSSTQKKVVERYTKEGDDLVLEVTTTDPFYLKKPWVYKVRSKPDPEPLALPWDCDAAASRDILKLMAPKFPNDPPIQRLPVE
jgi:hypothetical protein